MAFVVPRDAGTFDPQAVAAWLGERVAPYKRLAAIHVVESLPRTPSGKLLRRQLADSLAAA